MSDFDEILDSLDITELKKIEESLDFVADHTDIDDRTLNVRKQQEWLQSRMVDAEAMKETATKNAKPIVTDREKHSRTKEEQDRRRAAMKDDETLSVQELHEINNMLWPKSSEENVFTNMPKKYCQPTHRQPSKPTEKQYDNLVTLEADLQAGLVKKLDFSLFRYVSPMKLRQLLSIRKSFETVEALNLSNMKLTTVDFLEPIILSSSRLTEINLSSNELHHTEIIRLLTYCIGSAIKTIRIGRQLQKRAQHEEYQIFEKLQELKLRRFELEWKNSHVKGLAEKFILKCL